MSCDYKIHGEAILRNTPEVIEAIRSLGSHILSEEYVDLQMIDDAALRLTVDYDDVSTVNTPDCVDSILESIEPSIIGSAAFEITTSGETRTKWLGAAKAVRKDKSMATVRSIEEQIDELTPREANRVVRHLAKMQNRKK